eukprot:TRINITY_DN1837_c0_g1_i1.p1 TRINITY_DN1837_c0_g1~~TRINITY_DN1837_c0_g1_i1.p1  ORF type:complete len:371 (-),score=75.81 TRINITY_DN1837_c0_g1_i1:13-1125(-)
MICKKKRSDLEARQSRCPPPTNMTLEEVYSTTPGFPIGCAQWVLQLTANDRLSDLLYSNINGTNVTTSTNPVFKLIPPQGYKSLENSNIPDFVWTSYEDTFQIPSCGLYENLYYITLTTSITSQSFQFSIGSTNPTPITKLGSGATSISGIALPNVFDIIQVSAPNPSKAYQIFAQGRQLSSNIQLLIRSDSCPTAARRDFADVLMPSDSSEIQLRNLKPNTDFYFMLLPSNIHPVNYTLGFRYVPMTCTVPTDSTPCSTVTWPTPPVTDGERSQLAIQLSLIDVANEGMCAQDQIDLACSSLFYNCDANGFPRDPCQSDCQTLAKDCGRSLNCTATSDSFCYIDAFNPSSDASLHSIGYVALPILFVLQ